MLLAAGCGKEKSEVSSAVNLSAVESVTGSSRMEESAADVSAAELSASVETVVDETGVYPETTGLTELSLGINDVACTIKVPLNYILGGATTIENGSEHSLEGLGSTVTVENAFERGNVSSEQAIYSFAMTSLDAIPTMIDVMMYDTASVGDIEAIKAIYTDGKDIGDSSMPGWVYKERESTLNPNADTAIIIQVSDTTLMSVFYQGPVVDEVGEDEMAQRVYNLVTKK